MNNDYMDNYDDERGELENLRRKRLRKELRKELRTSVVMAFVFLAVGYTILWWVSP